MLSAVKYLIFSQHPADELDMSKLQHHAQAFFRAKLRVEGEGRERRVSISLDEMPDDWVDFTLCSRPIKDNDRRGAMEGEARGSAAGIGAVLERCHSVWELEGQDDSTAVWFTMCAVAASVALGPILPTEHDTLYGVRGAMDRAGRFT